jgi:hypothetical protein
LRQAQRAARELQDWPRNAGHLLERARRRIAGACRCLKIGLDEAIGELA